MPDTERKRYVILFTNKKKKTAWSKRFNTLHDAHECIFQSRHKATGYALYDNEQELFIKFKNFVFDKHEVNNFSIFGSF